jgi:hypothetical protein
LQDILGETACADAERERERCLSAPDCANRAGECPGQADHSGEAGILQQLANGESEVGHFG